MKRRSWGLYLGGVVLGLMVVLIARGLFDGSSTAPREKDRVVAERASTAAGAADERVVVPRDGFIRGSGRDFA
jgi:hypothetical protein